MVNDGYTEDFNDVELDDEKTKPTSNGDAKETSMSDVTQLVDEEEEEEEDVPCGWFSFRPRLIQVFIF